MQTTFSEIKLISNTNTNASDDGDDDDINDDVECSDNDVEENKEICNQSFQK